MADTLTPDSFTPDSFIADHPAQPKDPGFWHTLGSDLINAPTHLMDFLTNHPVQDTVDTLKQLTAERKQNWKAAQDAYAKGDYKTAAEQAIFSFPVVGPMVGSRPSNEAAAGAPGAAGAHLIEQVAPFAIGAAVDPEIAEAAGTVGTAAKGAIAGGARGAVQMGSRYGIPIPAVMGGAAIGGFAARGLGLPEQVGAIVGGGLPIARGAVSGARAALAARAAETAEEAAPVAATATRSADLGPQASTGKPLDEMLRDELAANRAPEPTAEETAAAKAHQDLLDGVAQGFGFQKGYGAIKDANQRGLVDRIVKQMEAAPAPPEPPPAGPAGVDLGPQAPAAGKALDQMLREELAARTASAAQAEPPAAPAPLAGASGGGQPVRPAVARASDWFDQRLKGIGDIQGDKPGTLTIRPTPNAYTVPDKPGLTQEAFEASARMKRADQAGNLAGILHDNGITSTDLPNISLKGWQELAGRQDVDWPKTAAARVKLVRDTMAELEDMEAGRKPWDAPNPEYARQNAARMKIGVHHLMGDLTQ